MTQRSKEHLQRRRKRVILLALIALALLVSPLFALTLGGPASSPAPIRVVVQPGDTLWAIACHYGPPRADPRELVSDIRKTNRLATSLIRPGQVLLIDRK
jgi:LysM domain